MRSLDRLAAFTSGALRNKFAYAWFIRSLQLCLIVLAGVFAFILRFEFAPPRSMKTSMLWGLCLWIVTKVPVFHAFGLGRGVWRYFAVPDLKRVASANAVGSAVAAAIILAACPVPFPRSVLVIDFVLTLLATAGVRAATRVLLEAGAKAQAAGRRRVYIYGAGAAGVLLLHETRTNPALGRSVCGFLDDDVNKQGLLVHGVPVRGGGVDLATLAPADSVEEVLIAIPLCDRRADGPDRRALPLRRPRLPHHARYFRDGGRTRQSPPQIRDVAVEDVLGRGAIELDSRRIHAKLGGRSPCHRRRRVHRQRTLPADRALPAVSAGAARYVRKPALPSRNGDAEEIPAARYGCRNRRHPAADRLLSVFARHGPWIWFITPRPTNTCP